jgi:outer membrane protein assembly factor BamB
MLRSIRCWVSLAACLVAIANIGAEDWPQFRGPEGNGRVSASLPTEWGADRNIAWTATISGIGWSQPISSGDRVFVTTAVSSEPARPDPGNTGPGVSLLEGLGLGGKLGLDPPDVQCQWKVLCLDGATGRILWEQVAREGRPTIRIHTNNSYASESPVTDGECVYALFGMTGLYCYDLAGRLQWSKELTPLPMQFGWGTGSSPVLWENSLFVLCDNDESSFLLALDKRTGAEQWRVERDERSNWSTPYLWKNSLRTELVTSGGSRMRSYDPATGTLLWEMQASGRTALTPVGDAELLYVDSCDRLQGHSGILAAICPGASGDISLKRGESENQSVAWSIRLNAYRIASPALCAGGLYLLEQRGGLLRGFDAKTGKELVRRRLPGAGGFTASPLVSGNRIYCLDENGRTFVVEPGPELSVVADNELSGMAWATPGVLGDKLLVRTLDRLYCIDDAGAPELRSH